MKKLLAALAALFCVQSASADTLIDNVNGYTIGENKQVVRFTGLLVGNDGRVKQLLQGREKPLGRPDYRVDGRGRTLIPGLIDAHGHVMGLGFQAMQLDLSETRSLQEAQAKIAAYASANPTPRWIVGRGWNQEKWGLGRFPTAADLDAVVPGRPVWLERVDGHAGWANSMAMKEAGVTAASKSPPGGRIEMAGRQPSGIFIDAASDLVQKAVPPPLPRLRDQALEMAQKTLLSNGITSVADMGTSSEDWIVIRRAGRRGSNLNLRILSYASGVENCWRSPDNGPRLALRFPAPDGRVKHLATGCARLAGAGSKQATKDKPGEKGLAFLTDTTLKNMMSRRGHDGFQVAVHAIGDAANAQLLESVEDLADTYKGDRRWRIEHAQIVDTADLPRFGRNGIIASMQPVHQTSDWRMAEARMGRERLGGAYAWRSMLANGVPLAFGSDFPVESPNPFHGLAVAVSREDEQGQPQGGWLPEQKVTMAQAFSGFTRDAAFASFAEDRLGGLERGRIADFLFIDRDIFAVPPREIRETRVLETWMAGRKVWERK
jgi:predicted amidohydrolase YtcJ